MGRTTIPQPTAAWNDCAKIWAKDQRHLQLAVFLVSSYARAISSAIEKISPIIRRIPHRLGNPALHLV